MRNTTDQKLIKEINHWRAKRDAAIFAHNYQIPAIQDLADYVGDSLDLAQAAAKSKHNIIVFCSVHFMAESAAIFSSDKTILIPDPNAGCSLASSINAKKLKKWKKLYPNAVVVTYVNTTAEVKAESDYCCTSANAIKIVESIPKNKEIIFIPDMFLGNYVAHMTGRKIYIYPGKCHVHAQVKLSNINKKLKDYPKAEFLIHPECDCAANCMNKEKTYILSTGGMLKQAQTSNTRAFLVATETGIIHRLKKENAHKNFVPIHKNMICEFMKMITLKKLLNSLKNLEHRVTVPKNIAKKARIPIEQMLKISSK